MRRAELAKRTGLSEAHISRIAPTIPGAFLRGKQFEFDETDPKFQEWLLSTQLRNWAKPLRREGFIKRDRRPLRPHPEIIKAMKNLVTSFGNCRSTLPKIRVSFKGCQLREPIPREESRQFMEFLVAYKAAPSLEEVVEISANLADFQAQQLFVGYSNSVMQYKAISGGEPLPVEQAYYTPGYPANPSVLMKTSTDEDQGAHGCVTWVRGKGCVVRGASSEEESRNVILGLNGIKRDWDCIFADYCRWARREWGDFHVEESFGQMNLPLNDTKRADAIARVPWVARDAALTSEHYYMAGKAKLRDEDRTKWLKIALEEDLSAVELKRSIEKGEVVHQEETPAGKGSGSGIVTIYAVRMIYLQWARKCADALLIAPLEEQEAVLEEFRPIAEFIEKLRASIAKAVNESTSRPDSAA